MIQQYNQILTKWRETFSNSPQGIKQLNNLIIVAWARLKGKVLKIWSMVEIGIQL
jgi:hypothetical protein